jgi:pullulanase
VKRPFLIIILLLILIPFIAPPSTFAQGDCETVTIHYHRRHADYDGWGLHVWGKTPLEVTWGAPLGPAGEDEFGLYWEVELNAGASSLNYIIHRGDEKDPGPDQNIKFSEVGCELWQVQGKPDQFSNSETAQAALAIIIEPAPPVGQNQVILHYRRVKADYDGWGLHIWGPTAVAGITWTSPLLPAGNDEYGIYWIIDMQPDAENLEFIIHKGDQKDPGPDQKLNFAENGHEAWLIQGDGEQFPEAESGKTGLIAAALGDIKNKAQAHWLSRQFIGWPINFSRDATYSLHYDPNGDMRITPEGLQGGQTIPLEFAGNTLSDDLAERFPHLWNARQLQIPDEYLDQVPEMLKGQLAIRAVNADGEIMGTTALQIPGVLDDLYANDEPLGVIWVGETPTLQVWAPTAQFVKLMLYADATTEEREFYDMEFNPGTGIWAVTGQPDWKGRFYNYGVGVYVRQEGQMVTNVVTDPYSFSLSMNSQRSQIVDLTDSALFPAGWDELVKPELAAFTDIALYELHVRDFSGRDETVPEEQRGTFMAFTHPKSQGRQHLSWLADQGITHIHLLPVFDIATINEDKTEWENVNWEALASYPPDSEEQQNILSAVRGKDGFNWGYDPYHYTVPEGSYSIYPDGHIRILEFRKMVQALNETGLRVVMDVVYNHTNASGQSEKSVLDRVVPGYYHRLDENGQVTTSTCCQNTATEHAMMRKLMIDSVVTWATAYKVDGFRFDLMGHHMVADMTALRAELDALTVTENGVEGGKVYVYGEGWDFGEVADNARGLNGTQENMAGTGIGTFNDRIRDAVRGGSPFSDHQEQGFATGLFTDPNEVGDLSEASQLKKLLRLKDHIRVALAGNLAEYEFTNYQGETITGAKVTYNGQPAGYTQQPQDHISYVSAHDNETLFDAIQYKTPLATSMLDRVKMQNLALNLVTFSQGIPFYHAGSEILRSKSMDRDSYDSTDWYNAIDWTYQDNNWGHGLPPKDKNAGQWEMIRNYLGNPDLAPGRADIKTAQELFGRYLQIRGSSPLFRLQTAAQIQDLVRFYNTGPEQEPGLIVMSISDDPMEPIDLIYEVAFVLFNADPEAIRYQLVGWKIAGLRLHPMLETLDLASQGSFDEATQSFQVPGRSTVVFVGGEQLEQVAIGEKITHGAGETGEINEPEVAETTDQVEMPFDAAEIDPETDETTTFPSWMTVTFIGLATAILGAIFWWKRNS